MLMVVTLWLVWTGFLSAFMPRQDAREIALTFTRPTIVATRLEQPVTFWHHRTFEDNEYMFVSRHYGTGGKHVPGVFVYSKSRGAWIQISMISTEHARLGRSPEGPPFLAVSWDYGGLIGHEYAPLPLSGGSFISAPDRIVAMPGQGLYRLDHMSDLKIDDSLTWFWVRIADLEAAFEGRRRTAPVTTTTPRQSTGAPVPVEVEPFLIAGLLPPGGGTTVTCLVDSTSSVTYVRSYFKDRLAGDRVALELHPGVTLKDQPVVIADHLERENRAFGGVLGVPFFRTFTVSIDYDRGHMYLADPKAFAYIGSGQSLPLEKQYWNPVVRVSMTVNGNPVKMRLAVDTSSRHTVVLNRRFVDDKRLSVLRDRTVMVDQPVAAAKHFFMRAGSVSLGQTRLKNVPVSVFQDPAIDAPLELDGVIGNGLLRRFRVTIDLSRQHMILEPGALFDVPYDYDLTGFTIVANGAVFGIASVEPGTSADRAGLRPGDMIEELDGKTVQGMHLADLQRAFVQDGRDRLLKIRRLGVERTTTLKMLAIR
jgi:hypothetical protein